MAQPVPDGFHRVTPHLVVDGAAKAIEFYARAFGAEELVRLPAPHGDKLMHAELQIGDSRLMLADDFPEYCDGASRSPRTLGGSPVTLHLYVEDVDAFVARAVAAGAKLALPPTDMFWGDRYAKLEDPFGHDWAVATHQRDLEPEQMRKAAEKLFS